MLSIQAITPNALELLKTLSARPELNELRLVGGTSLALQYGHRQSVDLEMFINDSWDTIKRTIIESVKSYQE